MKKYNEAEIVSLISRFEARELPRKEWTHEAHLVVAIWYLSKYPFEEALTHIRKNIISHNESVGTPNSDSEGYHETITLFWTKIAANYLSSQNKEEVSKLCNDFINSEEAGSGFPFQYYSEARLFSLEARHNWVDPDLKKIP